MLFRNASPNDISDITNIELDSFAHPWSRRAFETEFGNPATLLFVAERGKSVVGYICGWLVLEEIQILKVAVKRERRREGIALFLVMNLLDRARKKGAKRSTLEVGRRNDGARGLYCELGFREVARRHGYYRDGEDAVLLVKDL